MSKRPYGVQASPSSEGFIEQLKAAGSLKEMQDLVIGQDPATLASAFTSLLQRLESVGPATEEVRKKPKDFIGEREAEESALRTLSLVTIGKTLRLDLGCFNAFKSVSHLKLQCWTDNLDPTDFGEAFFVTAARQDIRSIAFDITTNSAVDVEIDLGSALAFGFAEPASGVARELTGARCKVPPDFFSLLCQKANEMDARQPIDVKLKILGVFGDIVDFPPKFVTSDKSWTIDDREFIKNGVIVKILRDEWDFRMDITTSLASEHGAI